MKKLVITLPIIFFIILLTSVFLFLNKNTKKEQIEEITKEGKQLEEQATYSLIDTNYPINIEFDNNKLTINYTNNELLINNKKVLTIKSNPIEKIYKYDNAVMLIINDNEKKIVFIDKLGNMIKSISGIDIDEMMFTISNISVEDNKISYDFTCYDENKNIILVSGDKITKEQADSFGITSNTVVGYKKSFKYLNGSTFSLEKIEQEIKYKDIINN